MNSLTPERLDLWYMTKADWQQYRDVKPQERKRSEHTQVIHITPTKPVSKESLKKDVVTNLRALLRSQEIQYYYVVFVVKKSSGELGFRTFIPLTVV